MDSLTEPAPITQPACPVCAHKWHGLPCTVGIGQRVTWGGQPEMQTCKCLGVWAETKEIA